MPWHHGLACFFGGVFLANFTPHFIAGVSGRRFPTPFASPPLRGLSSPFTNILWGLANLFVSYTLLVPVASLDPHHLPSILLTATGLTLWSLLLARSLTKLRINPGTS